MNDFTTEELKMIAELCDAGIRSNGMSVVAKLAPLFEKVVKEVNRREPPAKSPPGTKKAK